MIEVDASEMDDLKDLLVSLAATDEKAAQRAVDKVGYVIEKHVKEENLPHRVTGATQRSIGYRRAGRLRGEVASTSRVSLFLEIGTKPHLIRPRGKRALRFISHGEQYFRRNVRHPGTKAYKLFEHGLQRAGGEISRVISRAYKGFD